MKYLKKNQILNISLFKILWLFTFLTLLLTRILNAQENGVFKELRFGINLQYQNTIGLTEEDVIYYNARKFTKNPIAQGISHGPFVQLHLYQSLYLRGALLPVETWSQYGVVCQDPSLPCPVACPDLKGQGNLIKSNEYGTLFSLSLQYYLLQKSKRFNLYISGIVQKSILYYNKIITVKDCNYKNPAITRETWPNQENETFFTPNLSARLFFGLNYKITDNVSPFIEIYPGWIGNYINLLNSKNAFIKPMLSVGITIN